METLDANQSDKAKVPQSTVNNNEQIAGVSQITLFFFKSGTINRPTVVCAEWDFIRERHTGN